MGHVEAFGLDLSQNDDKTYLAFLFSQYYLRIAFYLVFDSFGRGRQRF